MLAELNLSLCVYQRHGDVSSHSEAATLNTRVWSPFWDWFVLNPLTNFSHMIIKLCGQTIAPLYVQKHVV